MAQVTRRTFLGTALAASAVSATLGLRPARADGAEMLVYRSPSCGCCGAWVEHMRAAGFTVRVENLEDLSPVKQQFGVVPALQSCHTAIIDGYVIEGHVPAEDVRRLLTERPQATGLSVPGMPIGSPGMEMGNRREPFDVVLFSATDTQVYTRH